MSRLDLLRFSAIGAAFWAAGVVLVRLWGEAMFDGGALHATVFALAVPAAPACLWLAARATRRPLRAMLAPAVVMCCVAMLGDGAAIALETGVYGLADDDLAHLGAYLLWFFLCTLASALAFSRGRAGPAASA